MIDQHGAELDILLRATEARMLKTFSDGYRRIRAIAERRLLAHPVTKLELTPDDFARP